MNWPRLILAIVICQMAGIIGAVFTSPAIPTWYAGLAKPSFNPPSWVFGPVWTLLYTLMGISLYRVWQMGLDDPMVRKGLVPFGIQLALNALWSILFFGMRNPHLALVEIALLWVFIVLTIRAFYQVDRTAARLLVPYLAWVSFASVLNFAIWQLNRG